MEYGDRCLELISEYDDLTEVFSLDVIGDWRASERNTQTLTSMGIPVIPTYHVSEPRDYLVALGRDYDKIAIGGAVGMIAKQKNAWASECFSHVWPCAIHGFGFGSKVSMRALPFHSTDATNWELGPSVYGRWESYGKIPGYRGRKDVRVEVETMLKLEREVAAKWSTTLAQVAPRYAKYTEMIERTRCRLRGEKQ